MLTWYTPPPFNSTILPHLQKTISQPSKFQHITSPVNQPRFMMKVNISTIPIQTPNLQLSSPPSSTCVLVVSVTVGISVVETPVSCCAGSLAWFPLENWVGFMVFWVVFDWYKNATISSIKCSLSPLFTKFLKNSRWFFKLAGGGFTNPFEKMWSSKWMKISPKHSGWKFQKYLSCNHLG